MRTFLLVLCLICIPVYGFWVFPSWNESEAKVEKLEKLSKTLDERDLKLIALEKQAEELQSASNSGTDIETLLTKIPADGHRQDLLIAELEALAKTHKYVFTSLSFSEGVHSELAVPQMTISFSVSGPNDPRKFAIFLAAIENQKRFFLMDNLNFSSSETNGIEQLTMSVSLQALSLK